MLTWFHESESFEERSSNNKKRKSVMKALKMSVVHVVMFVLSWTPYTIMATWLDTGAKIFTKFSCSRDTLTRHQRGKCLGLSKIFSISLRY